MLLELWYASHFARKNEKSYGKRTEKDKESVTEKLFKKWCVESFNVNFPRQFNAKIVHFSVQQILETAIVVYIILSVVRHKNPFISKFSRMLEVCFTWHPSTSLRLSLLLVAILPLHRFGKRIRLAFFNLGKHFELENVFCSRFQ